VYANSVRGNSPTKQDGIGVLASTQQRMKGSLGSSRIDPRRAAGGILQQEAGILTIHGLH
jgi:hypothetical protein